MATVIRISDVADIHYEPKDTRTGFRRNGKNSITLALMAQPGSNHVEIANEFYKRVEDIRREIPEGVELLYGRDTSINIRASIKEVVETILSGSTVGNRFEVRDMQGKLVRFGFVSSANFDIPVPNAGVYMVRIGSTVQKVRVK